MENKLLCYIVFVVVVLQHFIVTSPIEATNNTVILTNNKTTTDVSVPVTIEDSPASASDEHQNEHFGQVKRSHPEPVCSELNPQMRSYENSFVFPKNVEDQDGANSMYYADMRQAPMDFRMALDEPQSYEEDFGRSSYLPAQQYHIYDEPKPHYSPPAPTYHQPAPPTYHPAPSSYQAAPSSYQSAPPSYQPPPQPSYQPAKAYGHPAAYLPMKSYEHGAPAYQPPAAEYSAPQYQHHNYAYQSPAPHVPCSSNILISCKPQVSQVPCSAYGAPSYHAHQEYANYGAPAVGYAHDVNIGSALPANLMKQLKQSGSKNTTTPATPAGSLKPSSASTNSTTTHQHKTSVKPDEKKSHDGTLSTTQEQKPPQQQQQQQPQQQKQMSESKPDDTAKKQQETLQKMAQMAQMFSNNKEPQPIMNMGVHNMHSIGSTTPPNLSVAASNPVRSDYYHPW